MRKIGVVLLAALLAGGLPHAALAQGGSPQGQGQGPGARGDPERMEKRMRLARTLGLAEALDLDAPAALQLGDTIGRFDERRIAAQRAMRDARGVLRRAAQGEKVPAAEVDQAIQRSLDARAQLQAIDRETVAAVTQGLTPEKKARAVLFLSKFQRRFPGPGGPGMGAGPGPGKGAGMGPGYRGGRGPGGPGGGFGMGSGPCDGMGPGACGPMVGLAPPPPDDLDDEPED